MNIPNLESPKLNLNRKSDGRPLLVDMERFFEFSFWIAEELLDLVAEHRLASPSATQPPINLDIRLSKSDRFGLHVD